MLGFIGKWASSKGMGSIPDLEGLTLNEARIAITNAGFNLGNETSIGNANGANSSNHGKAKRRDDTYSLLDYESVIDFEYYSYVESPAPTPSTPTPSTPTPSTPTPSTPTPSTPTPSTPTPTVTCNGDCVSYETTSPTCNGEDSYVGIYTGTRRLCSDGTYEICSTPVRTGWGDCIAINVSSCGGSGGAGTSCTPTPGTTYYYAYGCCAGSAQVVQGPNNTTARYDYRDSTGCTESGVTTSYSESLAAAQALCTGSTYTIPNLVGSYNPQSTSDYNISEGASVDISDYTKVGLVASQSPAAGTVVNTSPTPTITVNRYVYASTPTPTTPTPTTPTPTTPTPTTPTPTTPTPTSDYTYCPSLGYAVLTSGYPGNCPGATPTPTTPTPTTPTPTTPTPTSPCAANEGLPCNCSGLGYVGTRNCAGDCDCPSTPTPTTPTPTTPTPVALDCSPCDPALSGGACGTYGNGTLCWTPSGCPNRCDGDYAPTPTPTTPTPTTPTPTTPTPSAPAPCTPNCQPTGGYICSGWAAIYQYADSNGCGTCTDVTDPYGCA